MSERVGEGSPERRVIRRPNFFLVGAMKAGTTAMHRYLDQHPDIFMSRVKEIRYFAPDLDSGGAADGRWFTRSLDEYLAHFARATDQRVVGESSHVYLHSTKAAGLIHEFVPDARILIMLRDPVQMVRGRHQQSVWMAREDITDLAEALAAEEDRRAGRRLPGYAPYTRGLQYREASTMAPQVRRYIDVFGPRRVHVELLEDLGRDPLAVYRRVLEFLGVDPDFVPPRMDVVNPGKMWRSLALRRLELRLSEADSPQRKIPAPVRAILAYPIKVLRAVNIQPVRRRDLPPSLDDELTRYFAPDVAELSELLGRDLSAAWPRFRKQESG